MKAQGLGRHSHRQGARHRLGVYRVLEVSIEAPVRR
jgi:hypothetical protein